MATLVTTLGITAIEVANIASDGGVATTGWATIGTTREDTAELTEDDPEKTELFIEESDSAFYTAIKAGKRSFTFQLAQPDADQLAAVLGGTSSGTPKKWSAPAGIVTLEKSVRITPKVGMVITIARGLISAKLGGKFSKKDAFGVTVTVDVLTPTKANEPSITATNPA